MISRPVCGKSNSTMSVFSLSKFVPNVAPAISGGWNSRRVCAVDVKSVQKRTRTRASNGETWEAKYGKSLDFGVSAAQGLRDEMEDVAAVVPKGVDGFFFAGVFDGHAGASVSQYLAEHLYGRIAEAMDEAKEEGLPDVLKRVFQEVDTTVLAWLNDGDGPPVEAGSTATCILARPDKVVVANVGDSRAVMCRAGKAVELSTEHRCYGKGKVVKEETQRIKTAGGWVKNGRVCDMLAVTRAFGDAEFKGANNLSRLLEMGVREKYWSKEFADGVTFTGDPVVAIPDVSEVSIDAGDAEFLIVATDGLWDVYPSNEAVSLARREYLALSSAQDIADLLVDRALKRKTQDNVSVAVVFLSDASAKQQQTIKSPAKKKGVFNLFG